MATGSGLDAQLGYKVETTVGTPVTVTKFLEFNSEGLEFDPGYIEPTGLRVGTKFKRGSRLVQSRKMVSGPFEVNHSTRDMGLLWKLALGSSIVTPTIIAASAYQQTHQTGDLLGKSMTLQIGRPEPSTQTVKPHTIAGCKFTSWEFSVADNEVAKFSATVDGLDEATATALASATYVTAEEFNFSQVTEFSIGNTIAGTNPLTESGGTAVTSIVKAFSLKGDNALATERFGLGNLGVKKEQLENGVPTITGTLDAEYLQSEFYTPFKANTATSLVVRFEGSIISGSDKNTIEIIIPEIRIKKVTPKVEGPDLVQATVEFEVYTNSTAQNPLQVKLISADFDRDLAVEVTVTSDDVDNLVRAIRTHADAKAIRKDLFRGLNSVGKSTSRSMTDVIDDALPSRGGLAAEMQATIKARVSAKSGKYAGVALWFNAKGHDVRTLTGKRLRHPVFGNRSVWVDQTAGVDPEVFPGEFEKQKPDMTRAINKVLEDIARKVTNI